MNIALFNERIVIQKNAVTVDEIGNHTNAWTDYFTCHATISGASGTVQSDVAGQTVDDSDLAFSVRYCEKTSKVNTTEYRIIFKDGIYDIEGVDFMNFKKKLMKFRCRKVRR
jgi:SPP1 family predicted phage head-tail adaptor